MNHIPQYVRNLERGLKQSISLTIEVISILSTSETSKGDWNRIVFSMAHIYVLDLSTSETSKGDWNDIIYAPPFVGCLSVRQKPRKGIETMNRVIWMITITQYVRNLERGLKHTDNTSICVSVTQYVRNLERGLKHFYFYLLPYLLSQYVRNLERGLKLPRW